MLAPVGILKSTSNYQLKEKGLYEEKEIMSMKNASSTEDESRYMLSDDPSTLPNISKKSQIKKALSKGLFIDESKSIRLNDLHHPAHSAHPAHAGHSAHISAS